MARNVRKTDDRNEVKFYDPVGGSEVVFYHRDITSKDRVRHLTRKFSRADGKLVNRHHSACIESAADILTGIRDGDFLDGDQPLSSTLGNPGYREDWREMIVEMAGDLLFLMGNELFEPRMSPELLQGIEMVGEFDVPSVKAAVEEELLPLSKSSGGSAKPARRSGKGNA